jgi:hypothetical protein
MGTHSRPLARLAAVATLVAFLVAQSWVVCAPLCLLQGHAMVAMTTSNSGDHILHCHSDKVTPSELPAAPLLGTMLPVELAQLVLLPRVVSVHFAPPAPVHLQQIPLAESPPPRSV